MTALLETPPALRFRDVVIVGGGCYGTFYARQLTRARSEGKVGYTRLLVVDRNPACQTATELTGTEGLLLVSADWDGFFDQYFSRGLAELEHRSGDGSGHAPDVIVPSPLMPHLMYHWLLRQARAAWPARAIETRPIGATLGTPYERVSPDGTLYVSFADWLCPTHCIEPALCPITRAPRTWEMADALRRFTQRLGNTAPVAGPVLFSCEHQVFGVGTFSVAEVLEGQATVRRAAGSGGEVDVVVGTISSCHGAVNLLHLGPA